MREIFAPRVCCQSSLSVSLQRVTDLCTSVCCMVAWSSLLVSLQRARDFLRACLLHKFSTAVIATCERCLRACLLHTFSTGVSVAYVLHRCHCNVREIFCARVCRISSPLLSLQRARDFYTACLLRNFSIGVILTCEGFLRARFSQLRQQESGESGRVSNS